MDAQLTETDIRSDLPELTKQYTREDLLLLACITDEFLAESNRAYFKLMRDEVLTDCPGSPIKAIMQFLGSYFLFLPEIQALKEIGPFIFDMPLEDMPLYINDHHGHEIWQTIVARWRLQINL